MHPMLAIIDKGITIRKKVNFDTGEGQLCFHIAAYGLRLTVLHIECLTPVIIHYSCNIVAEMCDSSLKILKITSHCSTQLL